MTPLPPEAAALDPATLTEDVRRLILDFMQMEEFARDPLVVTRADGVRFWDAQGREYLDGLAGIYVVNVGYNNRRVIDAMKAQLDTLTFAPPLHATTPPAIELGRLLAAIAPGDLDTVKLLSGGSEANEAALKLTRQYHRQTGHPLKHKVVALYGSYHGATQGALAATGSKARKAVFEPLAPGFVHVHPPYCYRCPFEKTYPACGVLCARIVEDTIVAEGPETVAALIVEPIVNTAGIVTPPPEYLPLLREICDRHGVVLIFDEIITGFGRTGHVFAADLYHTVPDILCCGKGMSSGYAPLAAILVRDHIAAAFRGRAEDAREFHHGHTYGGHPVAAAAGVASIRELLDRGLPAHAHKMGARLKDLLRAELGPLGVVGDIRGHGLMVGVELVRDPATRARFDEPAAIGRRVGETALRNGLLLRAAPHWLALAPPLVVEEIDLEAMVGILGRSVREVIGARPV
jgi:adenosylmethionine-8-amino-7-oxononanoate aminotransferase